MLDEAVKSIKVKNPITQEFEGTQGTYVQKNMEKQRSYNLPQWRELSEASNHQPPARRGERRRNQDKPTRPPPKPSQASPSTGKSRGPGRRRKGARAGDATQQATEGQVEDANVDRPLTPTSPAGESKLGDEAKNSTKAEAKKDSTNQLQEPSSATKGRQPKSVSSRRIRNRREPADVIDEAAFADFDYGITDKDEFTPERCEELERSYWKSITYNSPMYGADMPGSLFDDSTKEWNVAKLENLLDVLGQKVPGVNTAYLYLGMWKSTFAWHLEDVDLYSINYIHFGAPKQWYSISQEDARRFEAAMRDVWPIPAKACSQFLRHKTFLISPSLLKSKYNIQVNRLVHHEGEFVITFPYGYHSGYNLGYNCAESVNFATESWLDYGRVAKKCNCEADSVWVDVNDIERKLRGEETEYEESENEDDLDEDDAAAADLPTPPGSVEGKPKQRIRKRKGDAHANANDPMLKVKRIRIRPRAPVKEPCVLCPNDIPSERLLPTDNGTQAHWLCAIYTPETFIDRTSGTERICNVAHIDKARRDLKCNYCRSKKGACFQCSQKKCTRAYHPTCAAAAGVLVDMRNVPVFDEHGTEYTDVGIDFRCRYHRVKRSKNMDGDSLEENCLVQESAQKLVAGDVAQMQYHKGDIFAGVVIENRQSERTILVDMLPRGARMEVEYKWVLALDPADSHLPIPSANAQPLSANAPQKMRTALSRPNPGRPVEGDPFCDPTALQVWSEFHTATMDRNPDQISVNLSKPNTLWYYLGQTSTEARAQFTEHPQTPLHNPKSNFLELVKPAPARSTPTQRRSNLASKPGTSASRSDMRSPSLPKVNGPSQQVSQVSQDLIQEKPYEYKPRIGHASQAGGGGSQSVGIFQQHANGKIALPKLSPPPPPTGIGEHRLAAASVTQSNDGKSPGKADKLLHSQHQLTQMTIPGDSIQTSTSQSRQNAAVLPENNLGPVTCTAQPASVQVQDGVPSQALAKTQQGSSTPIPNDVADHHLTSQASSQAQPPLSQADEQPEISPQSVHAPQVKEQKLLADGKASRPLDNADVETHSSPDTLTARPAHQNLPAKEPQLPAKAVGVDVLSNKYPFLSYCRFRRPAGPYQSPYAPGSGFTEEFLPLVAQKARSAPGSEKPQHQCDQTSDARQPEQAKTYEAFFAGAETASLDEAPNPSTEISDGQNPQTSRAGNMDVHVAEVSNDPSA